MNAAGSLIDHRALLATIRGRLLRAVAAEDSQYADALYEIIKERARGWTMDEWAAALVEIAKSNATVGEFLQAEHARGKA